MECLQILDSARSTEVEGVLADTDVPRVVALALRNMREFVLNVRAPAQGGASRRGPDLLAQPLLQRLVLSDRDGAAVPEFSRRALTAQRTVIAEVGIKLDDRTERDRLHLAVGALDRAVPQVQPKRRFGKQLAIVRLPWFADDLAAPGEHLVDECAVDVPTIDQQLVDREGLPCQVRLQRRDGVFLGAVRGGDRTREDQPAIDVRSDVPLEPVEALVRTVAITF